MATLKDEGLHKPQDITMSPWAVQRYEEPGDHDLPTTFDIDYQNLSLLLQEAAILYPQCAKPKLYPTLQPYTPVTVTTPVVPKRSVAVSTKDPFSEGNRLDQGPTHATDYREYDILAVPLRRKDNRLPLSVNMGSRQKTSTEGLWAGIKPAVLLGIKPRQANNDGHTFRTLEFEVPLDHHHHGISQKDAFLQLHAELVDSFPNPNPTTPDAPSSPISPQKPFILYLCGGPGDGNPSGKVPELNKFCINRGYQVLYVHYRGTGLSPLFFDSTAKAKVLNMSDQDKANYLAKFRQDNIVRDLEAIRLCLEKELATKIKWTLICQSFGGWVATTYLSFLPRSLEAVYISAGMPPLGKTPREVYEKTYVHIVRRNEDYFNEYFPEDQEHVRTIIEYLRDKAPLQKGVEGQPASFRGYELYGENGERKGCYLTYQTFMTLGRTFGSAPVIRRDGDEEDEEEEPLSPTSFIEPKIPIPYQKLHRLITSFIYDLDHSIYSRNHDNTISQTTLSLYANLESFALHRRPLYALLHEAIYCSSTCPQTSQPSNWAAIDVALSHSSGAFSWLSPTSSIIPSKKYYFTGEAIHPTPLLSPLGGPALTPFLGAAHILAQKADWPALYDFCSLRRNQNSAKEEEEGDEKGMTKVKVRAVAYKQDMYVDLGLSQQAAGLIGGCELVVCPFGSWGHGSLKEVDKTERVLGWLFDGV
ncbi:hypothetical protein NEUTE1DRAFT_46039 [Neurospora tetrasperma FGSC 2508]|uniref:AB hydrolase-1 domain-containing protein n=1 Tax=Neurospora tetrasperma (strain FGSC 2508 / ATCC MYA-4615 / P0657) TaxID=510951 RepID=F8MSE6_NEUT8|nr:uncharacterized protein NEUTE1DRAFT_46039 [Neurospora tetrasperma FGSC 2508]EGO55886.1 hypothetical protein NEUTE1DRAFT_46039 [Neurospora tetrasperma FGSC 2508]EGZ68857.1 hypothetical protein NEUTE2DRAFT_131270 [Neurospora tetrasperma FGSC 2509]